MSPSTKKNLWGVIGAAIVAPLVLIGVLLGALSNSDDAIERIPVALVNNDEIIIEEDEFGEETFFLASRPLVLELVGGDDTSLDWVVTDSSRAGDMLASGEVYAVFEIPADFSKKIQTLATPTPEKTSFTVYTNPARSYLTGIIVENIGSQVSEAVNKEFGQAAVGGLFSVIVDLGDGFIDAADGASQLADGTQELQAGVAELQDGTRQFASGYASFDTGLNQYLDGVTQLAAGLAEFEQGTRQLPELASGVEQYTGGIQLFIAGLEGQIEELDAAIALLNQQIPQLEAGAALDPSLVPVLQEAQMQLLQASVAREVFQGLVDDQDLALLAASGETLSAEVTGALDGIREGVVGSEAGAAELAEAGQEVREGSAGLLSGATGLNSGVAELGAGVGELADGTDEFAEALGEGATEIQADSPGEVSDDTLTTLISPVGSEVNSGSSTIGVGTTITTVIIAVGLWLSSLLLVVVLPIPSRRVLSSTVSSTRLVSRHLGRLAVMGALQALVALSLIHTLGGFALSTLGWTLPLVAAGVFAFASLHYLIWAWKPQAVVPLSLATLVAQIATFGVVLPPEILPPLYQSVAGWGPVSWIADALLGAASEDITSRMAGPLVGLLLTGTIALLLSRVLFGRRRHRSVQTYYLTGAVS